MRFLKLVLGAAFITFSFASHAKEIRLTCSTKDKDQVPTIIILDEEKRKVWTQGMDGEPKERKLKKLTPYQLIVEDNSLIDMRDMNLKTSINYIESNSTYTINRIDGYMQFWIEIRSSPELPFKEYYENGKCDLTDKKAVF